MSTDEKQICLYCKWWKHDYPPFKGEEEACEGQCRVSPPLAVGWGSDERGLSSRTVWPKTFGSDFCGKFQNRRDDHRPRGFDAWQTVGEVIPEFKGPKDG